jgi:outer membrane protein assembly factor BamD (BamD/ComL family)
VALARGQPKQALVALEAHAKGYPASRLREEREALTVLALHAAGDASATARAAEFMRRYPQSLFGPAIEAQVRRSSDPR